MSHKQLNASSLQSNSEQIKVLTFGKPVGFSRDVIICLFLAVLRLIWFKLVPKQAVQSTLTKYSQNLVFDFSVTVKLQSQHEY